MKLQPFIFLIVMGMLAACTPSTQLVKTWSDPAINPETLKPFEKVLVIARIKDETSNRIAEDKIVSAMKRSSVPSYSVLLPGDTIKSVTDERLKAAGFDGLIVMQLANVNKSVSYEPGMTYGGLYGYRYASPGYLSQDVTFYVETGIYSLETGKLLWSGTTSTMNPSQLERAMDDIIYTIRNELKKKGFIREQTNTL